jgi:hypothetical protein
MALNRQVVGSIPHLRSTNTLYGKSNKLVDLRGRGFGCGDGGWVLRGLRGQPAKQIIREPHGSGASAWRWPRAFRQPRVRDAREGRLCPRRI